jgi:hypothetical protein
MPSSDNVSSAENQQERLRTEGWVLGFVDGEGCFSVPIFRSSSMKVGFQVQPQFAVAQGASSVSVLEDLAAFFECGKVYRNSRRDDHREDMYRYSVSRLGELRHVIVPFFQANPLRTSKRQNFRKFVRVLDLMMTGGHRTREGLMEIAQIVETMNHRKPSAVLRILRDHTPALSECGEDEMVRTSWRHEEAGGNDQPAVGGVVPSCGLK